jgi:hypothetical protein
MDYEWWRKRLTNGRRVVERGSKQDFSLADSRSHHFAAYNYMHNTTTIIAMLFVACS